MYPIDKSGDGKKKKRFIFKTILDQFGAASWEYSLEKDCEALCQQEGHRIYLPSRNIFESKQQV